MAKFSKLVTRFQKDESLTAMGDSLTAKFEAVNDGLNQ